jgi:hypothetical protein
MKFAIADSPPTAASDKSGLDELVFVKIYMSLTGSSQEMSKGMS